MRLKEFPSGRKGKMGRSGMQGFAGFLIVLSLSMLVFFNQHIAVIDWTRISSTSSSLSMTAGSYGMEGLHRSNIVVEEETKARRLRRVTPPLAVIGYNVLAASYIPCPPQSGHSYYTSNCRSATGAVRPYTRGCTTICMCARD